MLARFVMPKIWQPVSNLDFWKNLDLAEQLLISPSSSRSAKNPEAPGKTAKLPGKAPSRGGRTGLQPAGDLDFRKIQSFPGSCRRSCRDRVDPGNKTKKITVVIY